MPEPVFCTGCGGTRGSTDPERACSCGTAYAAAHAALTEHRRSERLAAERPVFAARLAALSYPDPDPAAVQRGRDALHAARVQRDAMRAAGMVPRPYPTARDANVRPCPHYVGCPHDL